MSASREDRAKRIEQAKRKDRRIRRRRLAHDPKPTPVLDRAQARSRALIAKLVRRQRAAARQGKRQVALLWTERQLGITEQPSGSNRDNRRRGITYWQRRLGEWLVGKAWCGVFVCNAWLEAGLHIAQPWRWASVALIEDDARAGRNGFRAWTHAGSAAVRPSDLAVIGGRGVHVEQIVKRVSGGYVCRGGNTSPRGQGSLANGGGVFENFRPFSAVHGVALVND